MNLYGALQLKVNCLPMSQVPPDSAAVKFVNEFNSYSTPTYPAEVVIGRLEYELEEFRKLKSVSKWIRVLRKSFLLCIG